MHANASQHATRSYEEIAREILAEADATDVAEDEQFGERRGNELRSELATAKGRRGWLREAKRRLDEKRAEEARAIPRSRPDRLIEAKRRLEEEHAVECRANADYEAYRARGRMKDGRRLAGRPTPARETRLYIGTSFRVGSSPQTFADGDPDPAVAQLLQLNNPTVTDVAVSADNELRLVFDAGQATVTVDAKPRAFTGDIWWFAAVPT
jgi:hypothetical protein